MGDIIRFRPRQGARTAASASAHTEPGSTGGAQILLFLGVRYERHPEEGAAQAKRPARPGGRRRRA
jgi:hypothetical protein